MNLERLRFENITQKLNDYAYEKRDFLARYLSLELGQNTSCLLTEEGLIKKDSRSQSLRIRKFLKEVTLLDEVMIDKGGDLLEGLHHYDEQSFNMLSGEEILDAYMGEFGFETCMSLPHRKKYLEVYRDNNNVKLLVMKKGNILGRALVWQTISGIVVMDRVYPNQGIQPILFAIYAQKNNFQQRVHNGVNKDGRPTNGKYSVRIKTPKYFPYLDTFCYFRPSLSGETILNSAPSYEDFAAQFTDGGHTGSKIYQCYNCGIRSRDREVFNTELPKIRCLTCSTSGNVRAVPINTELVNQLGGLRININDLREFDIGEATPTETEDTQYDDEYDADYEDEDHFDDQDTF